MVLAVRLALTLATFSTSCLCVGLRERNASPAGLFHRLMAREGSLELLRAQRCEKGWRKVVDSHHMPQGTHGLANQPGPLVRLTFRESESDEWQVKGDKSGRSNALVTCHHSPVTRHFTKMVPRAGFEPATFPF